MSEAPGPRSKARGRRSGARSPLKPLLLRGLILHIPRTQRPLAFRNRQQRRIKLHERRIHGSVILMAAVAGRFLWRHLRRLALVETKKSPLARKARFVFHMDLESHALGPLKVASLVD